MKQLFALLIACVSVHSFCSASLNPQNTSNAQNHLSEVNREWNQFSIQKHQKVVSFTTDIDRIEFHLLEVEKLLRSKNLSEYSYQQISNRMAMLDVLHNYAKAKVFPINLHHKGRQPYFIDHLGTHCAVGFLVQASGFGEISQEIARSQNYSYVREIESEKLLQWSKEFGFDVNELALIQPGYLIQTNYAPINEGTNGVVNFSSKAGNTVYFSGEFDEVDGTICNKLAKYSNNQLTCIGIGINDEVTALMGADEVSVFLSGSFEDQSSGIFYPLVKNTNGVNTFFEVPNRPNAKGLSFLIAGTYEKKIAIFTEEYGYEVFRYSGFDESWTILCKTNGPILDIESYAGSTLVAGDFSNVTLFENGSAVNYAASSFVEISYEGTLANSPTKSLPSTINKILRDGSFVYLAGKTNALNGPVLSRYYNGDAQPFITIPGSGSQLDLGASIIDLARNPANNDLILVGKLSNANSYAMYAGKGVFNYDLFTGYLSAFGSFNDTVRTVQVVSGELFVGGNFSSSIAYPGVQLNHLAKYSNSLELAENIQFPQLEIFPNPTTSSITISGMTNNEIFQYQITDLQGKIWKSDETSIPIIYVEDLSSGIYFLNVENDKLEHSVIRFVKN